MGGDTETWSAKTLQNNRLLTGISLRPRSELGLQELRSGLDADVLEGVLLLDEDEVLRRQHLEEEIDFRRSTR